MTVFFPFPEGMTYNNFVLKSAIGEIQNKRKFDTVGYVDYEGTIGEAFLLEMDNVLGDGSISQSTRHVVEELC